MPRRVGFFFHQAFLQHDTGPAHPESSLRLKAIGDHLRSTNLWTKLAHLEPIAATSDVISLVHPRPYIDAIHRACEKGPTLLDPDTVASPGSWGAALRAAGAVTQSIDRLMAGTLDASFCAVRPPGHHALAARAMGFCLFNNVAIGARYAQQRHKLERVLIVDWDVHHGNGTQAIFDDDPSVLYFSTHQFPYYPGTGARAERGQGDGEGFTINVPLAEGAGDPDILHVFRQELVPKALEFEPELILISAGFDAHQDDPLAGLTVTEAGFAELTRIVRGIADQCCRGKIVSALEGGYNLIALGRSVEAHLRALLE
jgi:acetoin utilization deacetylase AcuC-like enzyme